MTYTYRVEYINDHGKTVTREVAARNEYEAVQLAGAIGKVILSVVNCDL